MAQFHGDDSPGRMGCSHCSSPLRAGAPCFDWRRAWRAFPARRSLVDLSGSAWKLKVRCWFFGAETGQVHWTSPFLQYLKHVTSGNWNMFQHVKTGSFLNITSQIKSLKLLRATHAAPKVFAETLISLHGQFLQGSARGSEDHGHDDYTKSNQTYCQSQRWLVQYKQCLYTLVYICTVYEILSINYK